jgi:hypothetical protein
MNVAKRLDAVENLVSRLRCTDDVPHPITTLSAEEQELVRQWKERRHLPGGETKEMRDAQHKYMKAWREYIRLRPQAGMSTPKDAEILRSVRARLQQAP